MKNLQRVILSWILLVSGTASAGDLLVSSVNNSSVLRYDGATGAFLGAFVPSGSGTLSEAFGMEFGPDGRLHVVKAGNVGGNAGVLRYDGVTGSFIDQLVSVPGRPLDVRFGPDCNLYLLEHASPGSVFRFSASTGSSLGVFVAPGNGPALQSPQVMGFGPDGNLYVGNFGTDSVTRYDGLSGTFIDEFVASGAGGLDGPTGLLFAPNGTLYVSSAFTHSVKRYDGTTGVYIDDIVASNSGGLVFPHEAEFGADGRLYVVSAGTNSVKRYEAADGTFAGDFVSSGSGGLDSPQALIFVGASPPPNCGCSDVDGDGFGSPASENCSGGAALDCNDLDASSYPGASELCDGIDNDCSGAPSTDEVDTDADDYFVCEGDCNDANMSVNPAAVELPGNVSDENCDGSLGACDPLASWRNHGQFVRCVAQEVNALRQTGLLDEAAGDDLVESAARSNVGK